MKTSSYFALPAAHLVLAVPMVNAATDWPEQEMQQFMEKHDTGPLESKPGSRLQKDFEQKWLTWFRRVVVAPFQARIGANEGQSAKAVRLLEQGALQMRKSELADPSLNAAELARSCEEIIRSGLDDPLLLWVHSQAVYKASQNLPVAKDALNKARKHREFAKLPASSQYWVLAGVSAFYWKVQPGGKPVPSGEELIKAAAAMLTEEKAYLQAEDEVLDENLWPVFSERNLKGNEKQVEALCDSPRLTEWAGDMLTGRYHERLAWLARGHTFANGVTPEGWQGFEDQNLLAVKSFLKAWELRTDSPLAARELLGMELISEGSTGSESATWLARALEAQFDHLSTCRSLMNGLLPRWGGNHEKMLAFGVACAATRRFDTKLPYFFFESLEDVVKDAGDWKQVCRQPLVARVAIALCRQRVADAPTPELRQHALALQAGFGWLCGDYAAAQEALTQNEQPFSRAVVLEMLSYEGFNENLVRGESAIFAAGMADEWSKATDSLKAKNWEEAEKGFERVRGKLAGPAARLAASSLATARIEKQLSKGGWVPLTLTPDLDGWQIQKGDWSVNEDTLMNRGKGTSAFIFLKARVGRNFEIRGEFQAGKSGLGVVAGHGHEPDGTERWLSCVMKNDRAYFLDRYYSCGTEKQPIEKLPHDKPVRFEISCRDGKITWKVNDKTAFQDVEPLDYHPPHAPLPLLPEGHVGFCHSLFDEGHVASIRKVELRLLK